MKYFPLLTIILAVPAYAVQTPTPQKEEPHVCDIDYNANQIVSLPIIREMDVQVTFTKEERIVQDGVAVSDVQRIFAPVAAGGSGAESLHVKFVGRSVNFVKDQPLHVRTTYDDGKIKDYTFLVTGYDDDQPNPDPETKVAAVGNTVPVSGAEKKPNFCYLLRFHDPAGEKAAAQKKWADKQQKDKADEAEIALHATSNHAHNTHYVARGDASMAPTGVYDDGYTTVLLWPGNLRLPTMFESKPAQ